MSHQDTIFLFSWHLLSKVCFKPLPLYRYVFPWYPHRNLLHHVHWCLTLICTIDQNLRLKRTTCTLFSLKANTQRICSFKRISCKLKLWSYHVSTSHTKGKIIMADYDLINLSHMETIHSCATCQNVITIFIIVVVVKCTPPVWIW